MRARRGWSSSCRTLWVSGRTWAFTPREVEPWRTVGRAGVGPDSGVHGRPLAGAGRADWGARVEAGGPEGTGPGQ